jgi:hypothetical protein
MYENVFSTQDDMKILADADRYHFKRAAAEI